MLMHVYPSIEPTNTGDFCRKLKGVTLKNGWGCPSRTPSYDCFSPCNISLLYFQAAFTLVNWNAMDGGSVLAFMLQYQFTWFSFCTAIFSLMGLCYLKDLFWYKRAYRHPYGQIPPKYPCLIPYFGVAIPLLWDTRSAVTRLA